MARKKFIQVQLGDSLPPLTNAERAIIGIRLASAGALLFLGLVAAITLMIMLGD